jgi:signal transduction histidine kinase
VLNLLDNALKYAHKCTEIAVSVRREGRKVVISVEDDGPGIPPLELRQIFERFYRGKAASDRHQRGTGIGLSIVQAVAEGHGGRAWATSEEGEGAQFFIELPQA